MSIDRPPGDRRDSRADYLTLFGSRAERGRGNHEELMAHNGLYADLFMLQAAAYLPPPVQKN